MSFVRGFTDRFLELRDRKHQEEFLREQLHAKRLESLVGLRQKRQARMAEKEDQSAALSGIKSRLVDEDGNFVSQEAENFYSTAARTGTANQIWKGIGSLEASEEAQGQLYLQGDSLVSSFGIHGGEGYGSTATVDLPSIEDLQAEDLADTDVWIENLSRESVTSSQAAPGTISIDHRTIARPGETKVPDALAAELIAANNHYVDVENADERTIKVQAALNDISSSDASTKQQAFEILRSTPEGYAAVMDLVDRIPENPNMVSILEIPGVEEMVEVRDYVVGWNTLNVDEKELVLRHFPEVRFYVGGV